MFVDNNNYERTLVIYLFTLVNKFYAVIIQVYLIIWVLDALIVFMHVYLVDASMLSLIF